RELESALHNLESALQNLKNAQQELVKQERSNALGTMARGVVHDFANTLVPIKGYSEMLLRPPWSNGLSSEATEYVRRIQLATNDANGIVSRLKEFSKPTEEEGPTEEIDVKKIVDDTVALCDPKRRIIETGIGSQILLS